MPDKIYVRIPIEQQKLILGQIGNLRLKINALRHYMVDAQLPELEIFVKEFEVELDYFERYFPPAIDDIPF